MTQFAPRIDRLRESLRRVRKGEDAVDEFAGECLATVRSLPREFLREVHSRSRELDERVAAIGAAGREAVPELDAFMRRFGVEEPPAVGEAARSEGTIRTEDDEVVYVRGHLARNAEGVERAAQPECLLIVQSEWRPWALRDDLLSPEKFRSAGQDVADALEFAERALRDLKGATGSAHRLADWSRDLKALRIASRSRRLSACSVIRKLEELETQIAVVDDAHDRLEAALWYGDRVRLSSFVGDLEEVLGEVQRRSADDDEAPGTDPNVPEEDDQPYLGIRFLADDRVGRDGKDGVSTVEGKHRRMLEKLVKAGGKTVKFDELKLAWHVDDNPNNSQVHTEISRLRADVSELDLRIKSDRGEGYLLLDKSVAP